MTNLKRITDANLNRASEAARILEEIARFLLDDKDLSEKLKNIRHKINSAQEESYGEYLQSRDTENDVGVDIKNSSERINIENIFKANIKRLQQALRTLAEYSGSDAKNSAMFEKLRYTSYTLEKIMWEKLREKYNRIKLGGKHLYLVTNSDKFNSEDEFLDAIASAFEGGVDILQLREKNMPANKIVELGKKIKQLCLNYDATFIVNDRIDVALILEADGVHLGQDDLDVKSARAILGPSAIVGVSTHAPEQALKAVLDGADYIGVGPVFATPTKQGRTPVGLEYVKWVSENIDLPAFAIGGIDEENLSEVINAGIKKVAVVRAIINAKSPRKAAQKFMENLKFHQFR
ncbi:MAG: thiamine phosphate synthase [Candidatus Gastranaerophilaceae bacterium]